MIHFVHITTLALIWLLRQPYRMLRSAWRRSEPVSWQASEAFEGFAKANQAAWRVDDIDHSKEERVLIEGLNSHKAYLMVNLVLGSQLMHQRGLPGAGLLHEPNPDVEAFFRAYGITEFYYLSDRDQSFSAWLKAWWDTCRVLLACPTMDDFLNWEVDGYYPGRGVYDWLLRSTGEGTVKQYSLLFFSMLTTAFTYDGFLSKLFSSKRFPVLVQAERQFTPESILFRNAQRNGTEVFQRCGGPTSFTVFRFTGNTEEVYCNKFRFTKRQFDEIWEHHREEAVRCGGEFVERRVNGIVGKNDIPDAQIAYGVDSGITRASLCERFGWDPEKPIVVFMANTLTDGVFSNRWKLFRDNFTFLDETVRALPGITSVNWLVKSHPSDGKNKVRVTGKDVYEKWAKDATNVRFYPNEWGGKALFNVVDAVITSHGSPGMEYSCFGIPCVLGGEAMYSGRGFTHEPKTMEAYFHQLKNMHTLQPLTEEQVARARAFAFIYQLLSRVEFEFLPEVSVYEVYDEERYLKDAADRLAYMNPLEHKVSEMLRIQVEENRRHMLNFDWIRLPENAAVTHVHGDRTESEASAWE